MPLLGHFRGRFRRTHLNTLPQGIASGVKGQAQSAGKALNLLWKTEIRITDKISMGCFSIHFVH